MNEKHDTAAVVDEAIRLTVWANPLLDGERQMLTSTSRCSSPSIVLVNEVPQVDAPAAGIHSGLPPAVGFGPDDASIPTARTPAAGRGVLAVLGARGQDAEVRSGVVEPVPIDVIRDSGVALFEPQDRAVQQIEG